MPADSIPAAHSALTEMAAHPVSKSGLKRDYTILYPSDRVQCGSCARVSCDVALLLKCETSEIMQVSY